MGILAKRAVLVASMLSCLVAGFAFAGPPFVTDDPEPVELKHWEVDVFGLYNRSGGREVSTNQSISNTNPGETFAQAPAIEINYGAFPDVQLHMIVAGAYDRPDGGNAQFGLGDTELGIKYRFVHETKWLPQIGTFPLIEVPTGNLNLGLGNGRCQFFIPIWLQKSFGEENQKWTTFGGGGYWINPGPGNRDFWRLGWELQRDFGEHVTLGGEIYHETSAAHGERGHTAFNVGGFYNFDEHNHVLFSIGRDIEGPGHLFFYAGYQWTFGGKD